MGLKGYMLWTVGQLDSTCRAPPLSAARPRGRSVGLSLPGGGHSLGYNGNNNNGGSNPGGGNGDLVTYWLSSTGGALTPPK
jgi:hypothetical protein